LIHSSHYLLAHPIMKQPMLSLRHLAAALAFCAALTFGGARDLIAVAAASSGDLLAAELPPGLTLASAPTPVLASAVKSAIRKNSDQAVPILRVALLSRSDLRKGRSSKAVRDGRTVPDCPGDVLALTRPALEAAPDQGQALVNEAIGIAPDCTAELQNLLNTVAPSSSFPGGAAGFIGFPGLPGFLGGDPGGGVFVPVTPTTNN
jgi:hypothetical protein